MTETKVIEINPHLILDTLTAEIDEEGYGIEDPDGDVKTLVENLVKAVYSNAPEEEIAEFLYTYVLKEEL